MEILEHFRLKKKKRTALSPFKGKNIKMLSLIIASLLIPSLAHRWFIMFSFQNCMGSLGRGCSKGISGLLNGGEKGKLSLTYFLKISCFINYRKFDSNWNVKVTFKKSSH